MLVSGVVFSPVCWAESLGAHLTDWSLSLAVIFPRSRQLSSWGPVRRAREGGDFFVCIAKPGAVIMAFIVFLQVSDGLGVVGRLLGSGVRYRAGGLCLRVAGVLNLGRFFTVIATKPLSNFFMDSESRVWFWLQINSEFLIPLLPGMSGIIAVDMPCLFNLGRASPQSSGICFGIFHAGCSGVCLEITSDPGRYVGGLVLLLTFILPLSEGPQSSGGCLVRFRLGFGIMRIAIRLMIFGVLLLCSEEFGMLLCVEARSGRIGECWGDFFQLFFFCVTGFGFSCFWTPGEGRGGRVAFRGATRSQLLFSLSL